MIKLHGEEVKIGDRVWDIVNGWGTVTELDENNSDYPICVKWECSRWVGRYEWFTKDGKPYVDMENPTLFWQPLEYEIPKKPKQVKKEKVWQWVYFDYRAERFYITYERFSSVDAIYFTYPKGRYKAIEPYLPSEKERIIGEKE